MALPVEHLDEQHEMLQPNKTDIHKRLYDRYMTADELEHLTTPEIKYIRERRRVWRLRKQIRHLQKGIRRRNAAIKTLVEMNMERPCKGVMGKIFGHDFSVKTQIPAIGTSKVTYWEVVLICKRCGVADE